MYLTCKINNTWLFPMSPNLMIPLSKLQQCLQSMKAEYVATLDTSKLFVACNQCILNERLDYKSTITETQSKKSTELITNGLDSSSVFRFVHTNKTFCKRERRMLTDQTFQRKVQNPLENLIRRKSCAYSLISILCVCSYWVEFFLVKTKWSIEVSVDFSSRITELNIYSLFIRSN